MVAFPPSKNDIDAIRISVETAKQACGFNERLSRDTYETAVRYPINNDVNLIVLKQNLMTFVTDVVNPLIQEIMLNCVIDSSGLPAQSKETNYQQRETNFQSMYCLCLAPNEHNYRNDYRAIAGAIYNQSDHAEIVRRKSVSIRNRVIEACTIEKSSFFRNGLIRSVYD